jgi:transcriptional regulator with XRE-family HTH domain
MGKINKLVAENIARALENSGLTQKELAARAKINNVTLNRILNFRQNAGTAAVDAIAEALSISSETFYQREQSKPQEPIFDVAGNIEQIKSQIADLKARVSPPETKALTPEQEKALAEHATVASRYNHPNGIFNLLLNASPLARILVIEILERNIQKLDLPTLEEMGPLPKNQMPLKMQVHRKKVR